jgi:hypothetical protein
LPVSSSISPFISPKKFWKNVTKLPPVIIPG